MGFATDSPIWTKQTSRMLALLGANYRAAKRLKRKRKIGFHLRKFPILNKCSQNKERLGIFKDNNNAKSRSIALCFSR